MENQCNQETGAVVDVTLPVELSYIQEVLLAQTNKGAINSLVHIEKNYLHLHQSGLVISPLAGFKLTQRGKKYLDTLK